MIEENSLTESTKSCDQKTPDATALDPSFKGHTYYDMDDVDAKLCPCGKYHYTASFPADVIQIIEERGLSNDEEGLSAWISSLIVADMKAIKK